MALINEDASNIDGGVDLGCLTVTSILSISGASVGSAAQSKVGIRIDVGYPNHDDDDDSCEILIMKFDTKKRCWLR